MSVHIDSLMVCGDRCRKSNTVTEQLESRYVPALDWCRSKQVGSGLNRSVPVWASWCRSRSRGKIARNAVNSRPSLIRKHYNPEKNPNRKKSPSPSLYSILPCIFFALIRNRKSNAGLFYSDKISRIYLPFYKNLLIFALLIRVKK